MRAERHDDRLSPRAFVEALEPRTHLAAAPLLDTAGTDLSARTAALAKGVNLSSVFWLPRFAYGTPRWDFKSWPINDAARGGGDNDLIDDWEDYVRASMPKRELQKIAGAGFTFVRLPVDINFLYDFDERAPELGGKLRRDAMNLLRAKVREITDRGLTVILAPFRTDNATRNLDLQIWDPRWQTLLDGLLASMTRYMGRFTRDFNPDRVVIQPFNEPFLSEMWRAGNLEDGDWVVRGGQGEQLLRIRPYANQPADELTVDATAWTPIQQRLVQAVRRGDPERRFTVLTSAPLDARVTFKSGAALGDLVYQLAAHRNELTGDFAEASLVAARDYDSTGALDLTGANAIARLADGGVDRNVVYGVHYYGNGLFSTQQGSYYSRDLSMIYPLPFELPALASGSQSVQFIAGTDLPRGDAPNAVTVAYAATLEKTLAAIRGRLGLDANGETLAEAQWASSAYERAFVRDRRAAIVGASGGDASAIVKAQYLGQIVPLVARLFRYDLRSNTPEAIRDAIDRAQRWAGRVDVDAGKRGKQNPFVVVDEFGIRDHSWHLFGDTYRYVEPFAANENARLDWIETVRRAIDATAADNGRQAAPMGWAAWDYKGEMAITDAEPDGGGKPYLAGVPSADTVVYTNVTSYRRRMTRAIADVLGVDAFEF